MINLNSFCNRKLMQMSRYVGYLVSDKKKDFVIQQTLLFLLSEFTPREMLPWPSFELNTLENHLLKIFVPISTDIWYPKEEV